MQKQQLGQFFTTNSDYILKGLERYVKGKDVVDPFAGDGDLLLWAKRYGAKKTTGYDVDKKYTKTKNIQWGDSIRDAKDKKYGFIITNPPYLNVNKADEETKRRYFKDTAFEDLYQISLASLLNSKEGIVIVPINFLSAENSRKIRELFFSRFRIVQMNYFTQQVFSDTSYNVIAFYYTIKDDLLDGSMNLSCMIFPEERQISIELQQKYSWAVGGGVLASIEAQQNILGVHRLIEDHIVRGNRRIDAAYNHIDDRREYSITDSLYKKIKDNLILLRAIDSGSLEGQICLEDIREHGLDCLVSKKTSRHMVYLLFETPVSIDIQKRIIHIFNSEIKKLRTKYFSLFLTNFRDNNRKRISFDFVYKFINYVYFNKISHTIPLTLFPSKQYEQVG